MQDKNDNTEALLQQIAGMNEDDAIGKKLRQQLSGIINDLINTDFEKLVQLLYRLDIDEAKLKKTLQELTGHDAGDVISQLIIERQIQKLKSRQQYKPPDDNIHEDEKW